MPAPARNSTREAIEFTAHARDAGAEGALLLSPYYNKPTQDGIYAHYATIAEETGLPLLIYNVPGRTASNIEADTIGRLARLPGIVGVKEASGDLDQMAHVIAKSPPDFAVLSGRRQPDAPAAFDRRQRRHLDVFQRRTGKGRRDRGRKFLTGDVAAARQRHYELLPLFDVLFCETNPIPLKAACAALGWCEAEIRLPLTTIDDANLERLKVVMKDLGILR